MYINIHSNQKVSGSTFAIQYRHDVFTDLPKSYFSAGLTPGQITEVWPTHFTLLEAALNSSRALAVSGCGLNKTCVVNWQLQQKAFMAQLSLAHSLNKPIIVNSIRADDELVQTIRKNQPAQAVLLQYRNQPWAMAEKLLNAGFWLCFDKNPEWPHGQQVLLQTPLNRLLFYSDDAATPVEELYKTAAGIKALNPDEIILQMEINFKNVFKIPVP